MSANCLDNSSIILFCPISICSRMKDMVIIVGCPFLSLDDGELLDEDEAVLTIG